MFNKKIIAMLINIHNNQGILTKIFSHLNFNNKSIKIFIKEMNLEN